MNDAQQPVSGTQPCKWAAWIAAAGIVVTLIGILGATPLGPFTAMLSLTLGSLLLVVGAVVATIGLVRSRGTAGQASFPLTAGALTVGVAAIVNAIGTEFSAISKYVPPFPGVIVTESPFAFN